MRKLQAFVACWGSEQDSSVALDFPIYPSFDRAATKLRKRLKWMAGVDAEQQRQQGAAEEGREGMLERQQQPRRQRAKTRGSSRANAAAAAQAAPGPGHAPAPAAVQEQRWRQGLLPRPVWAVPAAMESEKGGQQPRELPAAAAGGAPRAGSAASPGSKPPGAAGGQPRPQLAAALTAAAWAAAAMRQRGALLLSAAGSLWLALFRRLMPVRIRRLFWGSWPPRVEEAHASPSLAALMSSPSPPSSRDLAAAGFNEQGE